MSAALHAAGRELLLVAATTETDADLAAVRQALLEIAPAEAAELLAALVGAAISPVSP